MAAVAVMMDGIGNSEGTSMKSALEADRLKQNENVNIPTNPNLHGGHNLHEGNSDGSSFLNSMHGNENLTSDRPDFTRAARVSDCKPCDDGNEATSTSVSTRVSDKDGAPNYHASRLFSDVVGDGKKPKLSFYPLNDKKESIVEIPVELAKEASKPFQTTAYGYFLGPRVYFPIVERSVKAAWGRYGCTDVMLNGNGTYFFKFNDVGGRDHVIEAGPLMVRGVPLFVFPWDATKGLNKPEHTSCPLWVKLHNIPLVAFNLEGICRIASAIGEPRQLDACTAAMCDKLWGRSGFAKVLIDVWAVGELKREVEVVIPSLSGGPSERSKVLVEYIWEPSQCSMCCVFGHKTNACPKMPSQKKVNKGKEKEDRDGFVPVVKKQWRRKGVQPNANMEKPRVDTGGVASTSHAVNKNEVKANSMGDISGNKDSEAIFKDQSMPKETDKGKEKADVKIGDAPSSNVGLGNHNDWGKTKPTDGQGDEFKHTPGPLPFYQSVLKSFQPRRGAPLFATNRFASLACDLTHDDDDDVVSEDNIEGPEAAIKEGEEESVPLEDVGSQLNHYDD